MVLSQTSSRYHFFRTEFSLSLGKKKGGQGGEKHRILSRNITALFSKKHLSHYFCHLKQGQRVVSVFSSFVFKAQSKFQVIKVTKTSRKFVLQKVSSGFDFFKYTTERMQGFWSKSRFPNLHRESRKQHSKCNAFVKAY